MDRGGTGAVLIPCQALVEMEAVGVAPENVPAGSGVVNSATPS
jgi:hypothetical protein